MPFVTNAGTGAVVSTNGISVNAAGEIAATWFEMPPDASEIVRITVRSRSNVAEADGMVSDFYINAGAENQPENTHSKHWDDEVSNTTNFAVADIVEWVLTDTVLGNISAGDSCDFYAFGNVAVAPDAATDTRFRSILVEYV
jgi:hypothetical protein